MLEGILIDRLTHPQAPGPHMRTQSPEPLQRWGSPLLGPQGCWLPRRRAQLQRGHRRLRSWPERQHQPHNHLYMVMTSVKTFLSSLNKK